MASALIGGMCKRGFKAADITVIELDASTRERLHADHGVAVLAEPDAGVFESDVLVLAVKPQQMKVALAPFAGALKETLVISIAAGLRLTDIGRWLGSMSAPYPRLVRCMPNTPALIGEGVTGMCATPGVNDVGREITQRIFASVCPVVVWVADETELDAVTAISGSGPAYVFHFIETLEAAGLALGLNAEGARLLAINTVLGAAKLAEASEDAPSTLREKVTSKGGTTAAALAHLAAAGWHDALIGAVEAASARSREMGEQFGQD
jgi:pyrroline-5-carboxylate reductase